jgi:hypothetical protein
MKNGKNPSYVFRREIPVDPTFDLVVVGGGPAGTVAAIAAAREGVSVLLIEATGALGGMGTSGLVSSWYCLGNNHHTLVGGIIVEICQELYTRGAMESGKGPENWQRTKRGFGFDPEELKIILDQLCAEAGVQVQFMSQVVDVDIEEPGSGSRSGSGAANDLEDLQDHPRIKGVIVHSIQGLSYIPCKTCIDATGDATIAARAGAQVFEAGTHTPGIMPPTLCGRVSGIDYDRFDRLRDQQLAVDLAIEQGFFSQPDRHVPGLFRTGKAEAILNAGHLFGTNALCQSSLSQAYAQGRNLAKEYTRFFQTYLDGCQDIKLNATASLIGIRESRRIAGEYYLDWDDFKARRKFPDQIGVYCKQVDIHVYDTSPQEYHRFTQEFETQGKPADGEYYGIPYGVLVPLGWENLWVAGRCVSTDIKVNGSLRDQPGCMILGQAAGTAAAQHLSTGQPAWNLDTQQLVITLKSRGAYLPQEKLSPQMTRKPQSQSPYP